MGIMCKKMKKEVFFEVRDRADMTDAADFLEWLKRYAGMPVTIDMSGASHVHTSIVQIIVALYKESQKKGIGLRLMAPPPFLAEVVFQEGVGQWVRIN